MFKISPAAVNYIEYKGGHITTYIQELVSGGG